MPENNDWESRVIAAVNSDSWRRATAIVVDGGSFPHARAADVALVAGRAIVMGDQGAAEALRAAGISDVTTIAGDSYREAIELAAKERSLLLVGGTPRNPEKAVEALVAAMTSADETHLPIVAAMFLKDTGPNSRLYVPFAEESFVTGYGALFSIMQAAKAGGSVKVVVPQNDHLRVTHGEVLERATRLAHDDGVNIEVVTEPAPREWVVHNSAQFGAIFCGVLNARGKHRHDGTTKLAHDSGDEAAAAADLLQRAECDVVVVLDGVSLTHGATIGARIGKLLGAAMVTTVALGSVAGPAAAAEAPTAAVTQQVAPQADAADLGGDQAGDGGTDTASSVTTSLDTSGGGGSTTYTGGGDSGGAADGGSAGTQDSGGSQTGEGSGASGGDQSGTDTSTSEEPGTDTGTSEEPGTDTSTSEEPGTEPSTDFAGESASGAAQTATDENGTSEEPAGTDTGDGGGDGLESLQASGTASTTDESGGPGETDGTDTGDGGRLDSLKASGTATAEGTDGGEGTDGSAGSQAGEAEDAAGHHGNKGHQSKTVELPVEYVGVTIWTDSHGKTHFLSTGMQDHDVQAPDLPAWAKADGGDHPELAAKVAPPTGTSSTGASHGSTSGGGDHGAAATHSSGKHGTAKHKTAKHKKSKHKAGKHKKAQHKTGKHKTGKHKTGKHKGSR